MKKITYEHLVGTRFSYWEVIGISETNHTYIVCKCDCGKTKPVRVSTLFNKESTNCGCMREVVRKSKDKDRGYTLHPLYDVWYNMVRRCTNPLRKDYKHYGARGITVCDRWLESKPIGFYNFIEDMYNSYVVGLELDRIDVNGNYEPSNCRWTTRRTQIINKRPTGTRWDTKFITYNGKTLCLSEWADELGIPKRILGDRLGKLGWNLEKSFTEKLKPKRWIYIFEDGGMSINELSVKYGFVVSTFYKNKREKGLKQALILAGVYDSIFCIIGEFHHELEIVECFKDEVKVEDVLTKLEIKR